MAIRPRRPVRTVRLVHVLAFLALAGAGAFLPAVLAGADGDGSAQSAAPAAPNAQQIAESIARLEESLRLEGDPTRQAAIERRLADLWVLSARQRRAAGDADVAMAEYEKALALAPGHRVALVELGWLHLDAGEPELARSRAETALAGAPDDAPARTLLGEIEFRDNRLQDALSDFTRAAATRPDDAAIKARIEKIRRELSAEQNYRSADSSHFVLRFDGDRDEALGELLLDVLEDQFDDLTHEIQAYGATPITVILYTKQQFKDTTGAADDVIGLFDGKVRLPVGGVERVTPALVRVVRHELVHALVYARSHGAAPSWLQEGLAQMFEPRDPARAKAAVLQERREKGRLDLEPMTYPKALSFVAFLDARESRARLLWFIDILGEKTPENAAFERAFGASRQDLIEAWDRWLRSAG